VIGPDTVAAGIRIVRAEEAWEPVLFGGMIPILGAGAIVWLLWRAVKDNPEDDEPNPPEGKKGDGPEDPPS
jgi:hypothetical protein